MSDDLTVGEPGLDDPGSDDQGFAELLELLESVADRVDALDALTGEGVGAQENRTIHQSRAWLARSEARRVRTDVGEVRRQARALAQAASSARDRSHQWGVESPGEAARGTVLPAAWTETDQETERPQRLVEGARHVASSVCWAQLAVSTDDGLAAWSAGELPAAAVTALEDGPRAVILAGADAVVVGEDDDRWPTLAAASAAADVHSVLALSFGRGARRGALVLAMTDAGASDDVVRLVAEHVAEHVASALLSDATPHRHRADQTRDLLDGARIALGHYRGLGTDDTFEALLDTARAAGEPVLAVAERLLAALVLRAPDDDEASREPAVLRRALSYIDGHATEDITIDDIAAAAGIGHRGLQQLFRRHRDVTPMQHLRLLRLDRAHAELQAAGPSSGLTVGTVVDRWRFGHPGRFSVAYRERFGVSPRSTLRS